MHTREQRVLVTGATGFIGCALRPALAAAGYQVRAITRDATKVPRNSREQWVVADLLEPEHLAAALRGMDVAYYLVHSMGGGQSDFRARERRSAQAFVQAAEEAGLERIVYLGGPAPRGTPSPHLASRLEVGELLRSGRVPTLELRASMVIGPGSASWQLCRDLALRLPVLAVPAWMRARTCPIAGEDVVQALVDALEVPLAQSAWFDIPGPDCLSGRDILRRIAALQGRRLPIVEVPLLPTRLTAPWLQLVTRTDPGLARELVRGLTEDLLPHDARYYALTGHPPRWGFDEAARRALQAEPAGSPQGPVLAALEERFVRRLAPALPMVFGLPRGAR